MSYRAHQLIGSSRWIGRFLNGVPSRPAVSPLVRTGLAVACFLVSMPVLAQVPTWTQLTPLGTAPPPVNSASAVYDEVTNTKIVFGGFGNFGARLNGLWALSNANNQGGAPTWTQVTPLGTPPAGRAGHTAVYDAFNSRMIVFGGFSSSDEYLNETWVLENANGLGGTPTWVELTPTGTPPIARYNHSAVYDAVTNRMIIFAGWAGTALNDVWVLENANGLEGTPNWIQINPTGLSPQERYNHSAVYDPRSNRMTVFGGQGGGSNTLWILENANGLGDIPAWSAPAVAGASPGGTSEHATVYDATTDTMVIMVLGAVWTLANASAVEASPAWRQLTTAGPTPLTARAPTAVYDRSTDTMTIFGGRNRTNDNLNETWVLTDVVGVRSRPPTEDVSFQLPVNSADGGWRKQDHSFGSLNHDFSKTLSHPDDPFVPHLGEDWNKGSGSDDLGEPVVAAASGEVIANHYDCSPERPLPVSAQAKGATCEPTGGWGHSILVKHTAPNGRFFLTGTGKFISVVYTVYAHLLEPHQEDEGYNPALDIQVSVGDEIAKGAPIGQVGNGDGRVPSHLHFEILREKGQTATAYREWAGYSWDLTRHVDPSEFIHNNGQENFSEGKDIIPGTSVIVHVYGDGSLTTPVNPPFLLDGFPPLRSVQPEEMKEEKEKKQEEKNHPPKYDKDSIDACGEKYRHNEWWRSGCNYAPGKQLGYNGEIFVLPTEETGTAQWTPALPKDGRYEISVYVPHDYRNQLKDFSTRATYAIRTDTPMLRRGTSINQQRNKKVADGFRLVNTISA